MWKSGRLSSDSRRAPSEPRIERHGDQFAAGEATSSAFVPTDSPRLCLPNPAEPPTSTLWVLPHSVSSTVFPVNFTPQVSWMPRERCGNVPDASGIEQQTTPSPLGSYLKGSVTRGQERESAAESRKPWNRDLCISAYECDLRLARSRSTLLYAAFHLTEK